MKRTFALIFVLAALLSSCGKADVIIRTDLENTRASAYTTATEEPVATAATDDEGMMIFVVNASSKTFHLSEECRHVQNMSEANKTFVHAANALKMIDMGYKPCATCIGKVENTEDLSD